MKPRRSFHFGKRVRLAALVDDPNCGSFFDFERVRSKSHPGSGCAGGCLGKQVSQRVGGAERDVPAEVRPEHGIESGRIAFVQRYHLLQQLVDVLCFQVFAWYPAKT